MSKIKPIRTKFEGVGALLSGYTHELIKREGKIAIYEQRSLDADYSRYEVIVIQKKKAPKGAKIGESFTGFTHYEKYPSSVEWGKFAWSYIKRENAEKKFNRLIRK